MFVILIYDVGEKRVQKVLKICRKYLFGVQKSVFEGELTESELSILKEEIKAKIDPDYDSVRIYKIKSFKYNYVDSIGVTPVNDYIL